MIRDFLISLYGKSADLVLVGGVKRYFTDFGVLQSKWINRTDFQLKALEEG